MGYVWESVEKMNGGPVPPLGECDGLRWHGTSVTGYDRTSVRPCGDQLTLSHQRDRVRSHLRNRTGSKKQRCPSDGVRSGRVRTNNMLVPAFTQGSATAWGPSVTGFDGMSATGSARRINSNACTQGRGVQNRAGSVSGISSRRMHSRTWLEDGYVRM